MVTREEQKRLRVSNYLNFLCCFLFILQDVHKLTLIDSRTVYVPKDTNLARRAHKHDDAAAKERDILKARVLEYEAASADAGGNVYLDETKLQTNRNRKLTVEVLDKNFGKSVDAPYKVSELRGRGSGPGRVPGRGRGRGGGRLFNPGRGRG